MRLVGWSLPQKNSMLKFSKFSDGIGFRILIWVFFTGGGGLAMSVFCGICSVTG